MFLMRLYGDPILLTVFMGRNDQQGDVSVRIYEFTMSKLTQLAD